MAAHGIKKITSANHTTFIEAALPVLRQADAISEITKVSLGVIKSINAGKHRIKTEDIAAGFRLSVRGACAIQEIIIYCSAEAERRKGIKANLETVFNQAFSVSVKQKTRPTKNRLKKAGCTQAVSSHHGLNRKHDKVSLACSNQGQESWGEANRSRWGALGQLVDTPPEEK